MIYTKVVKCVCVCVCEGAGDKSLWFYRFLKYFKHSAQASFSVFCALMTCQNILNCHTVSFFNYPCVCVCALLSEYMKSMESDKCVSYLNKKNTLIRNYIFDRPNKVLKFCGLKVKLIMKKILQGSFKLNRVDLRTHLYLYYYFWLIWFLHAGFFFGKVPPVTNRMKNSLSALSSNFFFADLKRMLSGTII